jgi:hypothetical protein
MTAADFRRFALSVPTLLMVLFPARSLSQNAPSLASLKDKQRVLLVFAPSDKDPLFLQQLGLLQHHEEELKDRDLVLIAVPAHVGGADTLRSLHPPIASETDQLALRSRFHVAQNRFAVILIGKDGGEKMQKHAPVTVEKLISTIDAMPMRKDEMRSRNQQ